MNSTMTINSPVSTQVGNARYNQDETENPHYCPSPRYLVMWIDNDHEEVWRVPCNRRACDVCGPKWAYHLAARLWKSIPKFSHDIHVATVSNDKWRSLVEWLRRKGAGWTSIPISKESRLILSDVPMTTIGYTTLSRYDAISLAEAELAEIPDKIRNGKLPKSARTAMGGTWKHADPEEEAEEEPEDDEYAPKLLGMLTKDGLTSEKVVQTVEELGGKVVSNELSTTFELTYYTWEYIPDPARRQNCDTLFKKRLGFRSLEEMGASRSIKNTLWRLRERSYAY